MIANDNSEDAPWFDTEEERLKSLENKKKPQTLDEVITQITDLEGAILPPEEFYEKVSDVLGALGDVGANHVEKYRYGLRLLENLLKALGYDKAISRVDSEWDSYLDSNGRGVYGQ